MGLQSITSLGGWALERAKSKLAKQGVGGTVRWALGQVVEVPSRYLRRRSGYRREKAWDRAHGVETAGIVNPARLALQSGSTVNCYAYQGCDPKVTVSALRRLPIDLRDYTFVDIGSGKGRALMSVRELGFRKIIGVEFSPVLCEIARRNWESLKRTDPSYPPWDVRCADATTFEPQGPTVIALYNPFGPELMRKVVELADRPHIYVAYFNPVHAAEWERCGRFTRLHACQDYRLYQARRSP